MVLTDGGRMRPLHPTLLMQYSSSRPTYAGLMFTYTSNRCADDIVDGIDREKELL